MQKKHILNSPRLQEFENARKEKQNKKRKIIFLAFFIIFIGLIILSRYHKFRISNIEVLGSNVIDKNLIEDNIKQSISGYYFFVLPKNNFVLLPEKQIRVALQTAFPRLTNINTSLTKENTITINVEERSGKYLWCGVALVEEVSLENTKCYFMDESGFLFDEAPFFSGNVYLRFIGPLENNQEVIGQNFQNNFWSNMLLFASVLKEIDLEPTVFLLKDEYIEIYLKHNLEPPYSPKIIFRKNDDIQKVINNFKSAILSEPLKTKILENYQKLEYINLSFGNKIYFKFKNAEPLEQIKTE